MSARSLPVAARLTKRHLRFLRGLRDGFKPGSEPSAEEARELAERLEPAFVRVQGRRAEITDEGRKVLEERVL